MGVSKERLVFDVESDALLQQATKVWILTLKEITTGELQSYSDYDESLPSLKEGLDRLGKASMIAGHFVTGFDIPLLEKLYGWKRHPDTKPVDTLILSKVLGYERFGSGFRHSLAHWGEFLGHKKPEHEDWSQYSPEMRHRCEEDVELNTKVLNYLLKEMRALPEQAAIKLGIKAEHGAAEFMGRSYVDGWKMDKALMLKTFKALDSEMSIIRKEVEPELRAVIKFRDVEPKTAKYNKDGRFNAFTANAFGVSQENGLEPDPVVRGYFRRMDVFQPEIGNQDSVKAFLKTKGWEPTEWNWKKIDGKFIKMSEKLTTDSLEKVEKWGPMIDRYFTLRARHSILKGWLEALTEDDHLFGDCFTIGTPTGRMTHQVIANIPSPGAAYGEEFRRMFTVPDGWKQVGADSSGCQVRALCHYLGNDEYTDTVINGDVHQLHTDIALEVTELATRGKMKRVFFSQIFGAGNGKIGMYLCGTSNATLGGAVKERLQSRIDGFQDLVDKIERIFEKNKRKSGNSWLPCIDGRKLIIDSKHKGLNYLLQSCEAITIKMAVTLTMERLDAEIGRDNWKPLTVMHDEMQIAVKAGFEDKVAEICEWALKEGPRRFGVDIMEGEAKIGRNWFDCH